MNVFLKSVPVVVSVLMAFVLNVQAKKDAAWERRSSRLLEEQYGPRKVPPKKKFRKGVQQEGVPAETRATVEIGKGVEKRGVATPQEAEEAAWGVEFSKKLSDIRQDLVNVKDPAVQRILSAILDALQDLATFAEQSE